MQKCSRIIWIFDKIIAAFCKITKIGKILKLRKIYLTENLVYIIDLEVTFYFFRLQSLSEVNKNALKVFK